MNILACDLGGTRMKIGVVHDGIVLAQTTEAANSKVGLASGLRILKAAWHRLFEGLELSSSNCHGISVAFPSLVDIKSGRILAEYGKYADAMSLDLRAWAKAEFGLPLAIENDARTALVGEWKYGAARGFDNVVMITLGTGLGTAALLEGKLLRGKHSQASVLGGHTTVRYGGRVCSCGNIGCAEAEASTAYLDELAKNDPGFATSRLAKEPVLDFAAVFKCAETGDSAAIRLRDHSLRVWSTLAVNLIHAYDPEVLIVGGGIMVSRDVILPAVSDYIRRHAHTPWGKVRVVAGELGDTAALVAGEWLLREQFSELK